MALSKIDVANMLTGATPVANGGTGLSSGTSGQFLKFTGSTTLASTAVTEGATEVDQWMVTSQFTASGNTVVENNWTRRSASHGFNKIGTGMTAPSSGIWAFPSTGVWEITWSVFAYMNVASTYVGAHIYSSENDFSGNIEAAQGYTNTVGATNGHVGVFVKYIFDVEDVSTHKVRFNVESQNNTDFKADSNAGRMMATFIRLGDTP